MLATFLFRVFLLVRVVKIIPEVISSVIHIPRVIYPPLSILTPDSLPSDTFVQLTMFNTPMEGGPRAIYRQILLRIVCKNLWSVSHISSLPMEKARFLYALMHGDSIDLPTFIC